MKAELGDGATIDVPTLVDTRLLVQANSGGGKSWALRRLLEQTHGSVQQIVLDLEGEFNTLREKYDYVLVGKGGDISANIKTADLLAKRLLELNVSAIIDLYELKQHERILFVKRFLDSMINAPKELWHPCIVVVDEAHVFCPEKGKSEAMGSVIDLCTRGRKRGYCAWLATQRLSKLHKDAAAECNNKLIGRTGLDVDMKRASEELGFTSKSQSLELRELNSGEFFAFGPAISKTITKVTIGNVLTTHPKAGSRNLSLKPLPPTSKVKSVLSKLEDLPKEADEELRTVQDYQAQVRSLKAQLSQSSRQKPVVNTELAKRLNDTVKSVSEENRQIKAHLSTVQKNAEKTLRTYKESFERVARLIYSEVKKLPSSEIKIPQIVITAEKDKPVKTWSDSPKVQKRFEEGLKNGGAVGDGGEIIEVNLSPTCKRLLQATAMYEGEYLSRSKTALLADVPIKASTFRNGLSYLKQSGFIEINGDNLRITDEGKNVVGDDYTAIPQDSEQIVKMWLNRLSPAFQNLLRSVIARYPDSISREDLSVESGVPLEASTFRNGLSQLKTLGLVKITNEGVIASEELMT